MNMDTPTFSRRNNYKAVASDITIREDAPQNLRSAIILIAENIGMAPSNMRSEICSVLLVAEDRNNWSEYPNIYEEAKDLVSSCAWHKVYDIAEKFYARLATLTPTGAQTFETRLNEFMEETGIGWQMKHGLIITRGSESFSNLQGKAEDILKEAGKKTAANEISEAFIDLSRRPHPDLSGSIQHAMAAVECLLREFSPNGNATLGTLISDLKDKDIIPKPLDNALIKLWGYSSENGRHLKDGKDPSFEEAELTVTICSAVCTYLGQKIMLHKILS
jgi:hypothetical protein